MSNNNILRANSNGVTISMVKILAKQKQGFQFCHINAQSLKPKIDEFRLIFESSNMDVICVSETWLNESIPNGLISLHGYKVFRSDRLVGGGGGVAIYVKDNITCKVCSKTEQFDIIEHIFVEVSSFGRKMLVGCVYRPNSSIAFSNFIMRTEALIMPYNDILIAGDFNSNLLTETSFRDSMESIGLTPTNTTTATHFTKTNNTLLDLIFVGDTSKVLLYDQISASCFSKHDLIFATYDFMLEQKDLSYSFRDFRNLNYSLLCENILQINWSNIYHMASVDEQLSFLESNILQLYDETVPLKTKNIKPKNNPWFNDTIQHAIKRRDLAYSRWKRFKTEALKVEFCSARREVNNQIKIAKSDYYSRQFGSALESKRTWRTIRDIGIGVSINKITPPIDADSLNNMFACNSTVSINDTAIGNSIPYNNSMFERNMFEFSCVSQFDVFNSFNQTKSNAVGYDNLHPKFIRVILPFVLPYITHLFNTIITTSYFPEKWKHAKIIPIPKSVAEYRPIAILSFLSKVLEKLLHHQISSYISNNNLLSDRQSGFRPKHSCITTLIDVAENIRRDLDDGKINFLVLLDHSKAFDTVNHRILLSKLRTLFKFSYTSTKLIASYLTDRIQSVFINNKASSPLLLSRGVPQGSILGPILFSIYANDLPQHLSHCKVHMYADDVQLHLSSPVASIKENVEKLNSDLNNVHLWATENGLCLNPLKSKCLLIHKKTVVPLIEDNILIDNKKIDIVQTARNLGVVFNSNLTWANHISTLVGQIYVKLRTLWSVQHFTPINVRILLAKAYLIPSITYGCELFSNCDSISKRKLEVLYNNIIRYIHGLKKRDQVSAYSKTIYGVTFGSFLKIRVLLFLQKLIYTQKPDYLFEKISFARSARGKRIILPKFRCLVSEWQFFITAIRLWNALPYNQQTNNNAISFREYLFNSFE